jgi:hypothetical protein
LPTIIHDTQLDAHIEETNEALKNAISQVNTQFERAAGEFRQIGEFTRGGEHASV